VTKRRPSWSDIRRQVALLVGGLWLAGAQATPAVLDPLLHRESTDPALIQPDLKRGVASFYSARFHGRKTASGERFDRRQFTAASNHFPLGSWVAIRRPDNGRCAVVRINDRMHARHTTRIVDLAHGVAAHLNMLRDGVASVEMVSMWAGWEREGVKACQVAFARPAKIAAGDGGPQEDALPLLTDEGLPSSPALPENVAPAAGIRP